MSDALVKMDPSKAALTYLSSRNEIPIRKIIVNYSYATYRANVVELKMDRNFHRQTKMFGNIDTNRKGLSQSPKYRLLVAAFGAGLLVAVIGLLLVIVGLFVENQPLNIASALIFAIGSIIFVCALLQGQNLDGEA